MAYALERDEVLLDGVQRIVAKQTSSALTALASAGGQSAGQAAYECRKRCKKVRGVLRLVRGSLGERYWRANAAYRDAARQLAPLRDVVAGKDTLDALLVSNAGDQRYRALIPLKDALARPVASLNVVEFGSDRLLTTAAQTLQACLDDLDQWYLEDDGWSAMQDGVADTYERGAHELSTAIADPNAANLHAFRKRAKYTWFHLRLVERSAPQVVGPLANEFHHLTVGLGEANDLARLADRVLADPSIFRDERTADEAFYLIDEYRRRLVDRCMGLAVRLYTETPEAFAHRLGWYWQLWHHFGDPTPIETFRRFDTTPSAQAEQTSDSADETQGRELGRSSRVLTPDPDPVGRSSIQTGP